MLGKWHILDCAARSWLVEHVKIIWRGCFLLHNMTIRMNQEEKAAALLLAAGGADPYDM